MKQQGSKYNVTSNSVRKTTFAHPKLYQHCVEDYIKNKDKAAAVKC